MVGWQIQAQIALSAIAEPSVTTEEKHIYKLQKRKVCVLSGIESRYSGRTDYILANLSLQKKNREASIC